MEILLLFFEILLSSAVSYIIYKIKKIREAELRLEIADNDFKDLTLLNTRITLIRECQHYIDKGFAPIYARSTLIAIFNKYHALGGNGGIDELFHIFLNLPLNEVKT